MKNSEKTLIILDVDETLIHATEDELGRQADFKVFDYYVYKRPYLEEFLKSLENEFLLAIWSSASDDFVEAVIGKIISEEIELEFVWGRSRCLYKRNIQIDENGYYNSNYDNHYHYIKPLKKVKKKGYDLSRILIIDDSPHKSQLNYGNAIYPKEYKGEEEDDELKYLVEYLKLLKDRKDVRRVEKRGWRSKIEHKLKNKGKECR